MRILTKSFLFIFLSLFLLQCSTRDERPEEADVPPPAKPKKQRVAPKNEAVQFVRTGDWTRQKPAAKEMDIVLALNRVDKKNLARLDSILVPLDAGGDLEFYLPFPFDLPSLAGVKKILLFSYPAQAFAAYEYGQLVYSGPTSMGRKADPTPTQLYFANWKAEETTSTFDDEWELKWNFNIENKLGVGFHEYELPGYPASHSCLRLLEKDARYLYDWADQWVLDKKDENKVLAQGTPVFVFGAYPFGQPRPWFQLAADPTALDIKAADLEAQLAPHVPKIMAEQERRQKIRPE